MNNRFKKLFGLAKELNINKDDLSAGAAYWTGVDSLRSLNAKQIIAYEKVLEREKKKRWTYKRSKIESKFETNELLYPEQRRFLIDLITTIFADISQFRAWLQRYFGVSSERFLDSQKVQKIIKALTDMRKRRFKACQGDMFK